MNQWIAIFVVVAAVALVVQAAILCALFFQVRRIMRRVESFTTDLQTRMGPIITRIQLLLEDTQPRISEMVSDASHMVYLARSQAQKVDRIFTDVTDRLHVQLVHVDRILTGVMEAVEDAGSRFSRGFWKPVQKASALVEGIRVGLDFLRSRRGRSDSQGTAEQEEELFI